VLIPPIPSLIIGTLAYAKDPSFPTTPLLALTFPLGLLFLAVLPLGIRNPSPNDHVRYATGARQGLLLGTIIVIPTALMWGIVFHQYSLGEDLMVVTVGSFLLPAVSASGAEGYLLTKTENSDKFFSKASLSPANTESVAIVLLGFFLRVPGLLRKLQRTVMSQMILTALYFYGWIAMTLEGGFPYTLLGLAIGFLVPLSALISLERMVGPEERKKLSTLLLSRAPVWPGERKRM
jgi:hypothetical protein